MYTAFVIIDVFLAIALIVLVLMQQGKGADAGAAFGGGSSATVFGAAGGGSVMTKITTWIAVAFFAITLGLSVLAKERVQFAQKVKAEPSSVVQEIPEVGEPPAGAAPASSDEVPALPAGLDEIPEQPAAAVQQPASSDEIPPIAPAPGDHQGG